MGIPGSRALGSSPHPAPYLLIQYCRTAHTQGAAIHIPGVPASVPNPNILWDLLRSSCDPGMPKALRFPGISCFPQRMGRVGSDRDGDPRTCCHLPSQGVGAAIWNCWKIFKQKEKPHFPSPPGDETGDGAGESRAGITMTAR